jgi:predicted lipoprotein with Yx(FWY)xxD motif
MAQVVSPIRTANGRRLELGRGVTSGRAERPNRMRTLLFTSLVAVVAGGLATSTASMASSGASASTVYVGSSQFGPILFAGNGRALYAFTRDPRRRSACSGACAAAWPPFLVSSRARAGRGARTALLGTIRRANGTRQVTYAGRPLYYYVGDRSPGQVLCQNVREFGGLWLVVRASGRLVR